MNYFETTIRIDEKRIDSDIIVAELAEIGYESFDTNSDILKAYIQEVDYNQNAVEECIIQLGISDLYLQTTLIERVNWNQQWESSYEPIEVDDFCYIRAPFHQPKPGFTYQLLIEPKMSFGTGHHQTTKLMLKAMRKYTFTSQNVLDMGSGTGILAIVAKKMGSAKTVAIDIDEWSIENTKENIVLNETPDIECILGDSSKISGQFGLILANINRNILLKEMNIYSTHLESNGLLFLSGFFTCDEPIITDETKKHKLQLIDTLTDDQWTCLVLQKQ